MAYSKPVIIDSFMGSFKEEKKEKEKNISQMENTNLENIIDIWKGKVGTWSRKERRKSLASIIIIMVVAFASSLNIDKAAKASY